MVGSMVFALACDCHQMYFTHDRLAHVLAFQLCLLFFLNNYIATYNLCICTQHIGENKLIQGKFGVC